MQPSRTEPASFRDPANRVFYVDRRVLRGLDERSARDWRALRDSGLYDRLRADGGLVATEELPVEELRTIEEARGWSVVLEHEAIPFVSYPYEWTFSMLRDAAALHLDLLLTALDTDTTMKDGYAFNVQWRGPHPVFIDVPSFERTTGGPWAGYRQFCTTFLYPLMLQAYRDVAFQPLLRGAVDGIPPEQMRRLLSFRDRFRAGVWKNVHLHEALSRRFAGASTQQVERDARKAGFDTELSKAMVRKLRKLVGKLRWKRSASTWSDYRKICSYTDDATEAKQRFVETAAAERPRALVWDLGCNEGTFARIAARHAETVVAVDSDVLVVDHLYRALREDGVDNVLPLVMDLTDPSPALGWRGSERRAFTDRGAPDLVLALALVHHLAVAANVPLPEVVRWLRSFDAEIVVELPDRDDPMAQRLLANKPAHVHADYGLATFEPLLGEAFEIHRREVLPGGTRTIFHASPRP